MILRPDSHYASNFRKGRRKKGGTINCGEGANPSPRACRDELGRADKGRLQAVLFAFYDARLNSLVTQSCCLIRVTLILRSLSS